MKSALITVDVEDWIQSTWDRKLPITERSATNTHKLLELMDELNIKSTMFVLGKFAESFPKIVKEIYLRGHEIASHGYSHIEIFKQNRKEFKSDVERSKKYLEDLIGDEVLGYRAPDFSIINSTLWALRTLSELGFKYDSSIYPIKHGRYGIEKFPAQPINVMLETFSILEFPISTISIKNKNIPIGGGGYHRLLPSFLINRIAARVLTTKPFIYYCHPYEFNVNELNEIRPVLPLKVRLHQGMGRKYFKKRFVSFVKNFGSVRIKDAIAEMSFPSYQLSGEEVLTND
ncbi:MAG: hypothetical protein AUK34_12255 [Ignavibacteria bacterium CG2_30_36_16]|nr:MAG: hypothetical protein AUK34_12255 [Ignavibacteria bacterium CG2_30_36_16]